MRRFYSNSRNIVRDKIYISDKEQIHHIVDVLRLKAADAAVIFDEKGNEYQAEIEKLSLQNISLRIKEVRRRVGLEKMLIAVACAIPKKSKIDDIIDKLVQLGVDRIIPLITERVIIRMDKEKKSRRQSRWEKIAIGASKQCGRGVVPKIDPLQEYPQILQSVPEDTLRLILWEEGGKRLKEVLKKLERKTAVFFLVGPEGGLTKEEVEEAKRADFTPITLGERVLRSETAGLCLLSVLQYEWGDIG